MSSISSNNKTEKLSSKLARMSNSAMAFVIAYMIVVFLFSVSTALMGKLFGFDSQISFSGLRFELGRHRWDKMNVAVIWSFGTLFTFLLGVIFSYLFSEFRTRVYLANLVFLWGAVISFSIVTAQAVLPLLEPGQQLACYTNLSVVYNWLSVPTVLAYMVCIIFILLLALYSIYSSKHFLAFSYSFSKVSKAGRKRKFFAETVVIPFFLACLIILAFTNTTYPFVNFKALNIVYMSTVALSLVFSFLVININDMKSEEVMRYKNLQRVNAVLFLLFIILLIFFTTAKQGFYMPI